MSDPRAKAEAAALIAKYGKGGALLYALTIGFLKLALGLAACAAIGGVVALTIRAVMFGWGLVW